MNASRILSIGLILGLGFALEPLASSGVRGQDKKPEDKKPEDKKIDEKKLAKDAVSYTHLTLPTILRV